MKEAEYFGDIVIVPYMDDYDLLVLKTIAICDYGVSFAKESTFSIHSCLLGVRDCNAYGSPHRFAQWLLSIS